MCALLSSNACFVFTLSLYKAFNANDCWFIKYLSYFLNHVYLHNCDKAFFICDFYCLKVKSGCGVYSTHAFPWFCTHEIKKGFSMEHISITEILW